MRHLRILTVVLLAGCGPKGDPGPPGADGVPYFRTIVVSPKATETASGRAIEDALNSITTASLNNPFLVKLEPGVYDIAGTSQGALFMKDHVDIEGSGELSTTLRGAMSNTILAADAELRSVTVLNSGSGTFQTAVSTYATVHGFRMTHVTAVGEGGTFAFGFSGNGLLRDCTLRGIGGGTSIGIQSNTNGEVTVINSVIEGAFLGIRLQSGTGRVNGSQVIGGGSGVTCVYCYDANFAPLNSACN